MRRLITRIKSEMGSKNWNEIGRHAGKGRLQEDVLEMLADGDEGNKDPYGCDLDAYIWGAGEHGRLGVGDTRHVQIRQVIFININTHLH